MKNSCLKTFSNVMFPKSHPPLLRIYYVNIGGTLILVVGLNIQRYYRQQNKCYPQRCQIVRKTADSAMKFGCSNKFDLCYYGQVNSLYLKSSVTSNERVNTFGGKH